MSHLSEQILQTLEVLPAEDRQQVLDFAELVRMAELYPNSSVFTLDSDFQIYRKNRDRPILLLSPQSGT